ncbi:MAG: glycosyltransferase family 9 protein [Verrucomicrobiales bacterium]|nr:glycosyltransferase family 9 protein [Verrucomicrobiales bacterium]
MKFKFLGDVALMTPALRALRDAYPRAELHVLVAEESAPILRHLPWIDRVWAMPRKRGTWQVRALWPMVKQLRAEKFDRSVDFAGNDRGAIMSLVIGAKLRLAYKGHAGFLGRARCYHKLVPRRQKLLYEPWYDLVVLREGWGVRLPKQIQIEIAADSGLAGAAAELLPTDCMLCHISSTQPKKQWPLARWREFAAAAHDAGLRAVFSAGVSQREQEELAELRRLDADVEVLPPVRDLALFLAVVRRARVFVSVDTGPLHFAVGLGVPTVSLFGASGARSWAPQGPRHRVLTGGKCRCPQAWKTCANHAACMVNISSGRALEAARQLWRVGNKDLTAS